MISYQMLGPHLWANNNQKRKPHYENTSTNFNDGFAFGNIRAGAKTRYCIRIAKAEKGSRPKKADEFHQDARSRLVEFHG